MYPVEGRLVRGDEETRLQPLPMAVLLLLAERYPAAAERDEILDVVWHGRAQTDEPLTRCIGEIRRALGESRADPEYIRTIPKRGYRLLQVPEPLFDDEERPPVPKPGARNSPPPRRLSSPLALAGLAIAAVLLIGVLLMTRSSDEAETSESAPPNSIAVLAFENLSPDPDNEFFATGLSEEILNGLARVGGLVVTARTSSFAFRGQAVDVRSIGERLNVAWVLEGSVRYADETFRITAQLIDAGSGTHVWSNSYDRPAEGILDVQEDITAELTTIIVGELVDEGALSSRTGNVAEKAFTLFLQARSVQRTSGWSEIGRIEESISHLQAAVDIEPDYFDAWILLADAYRALAAKELLYEPSEVSSAMVLAQSAQKQAARIDPDHSDTIRLEGEMSEGVSAKIEAFKRAIEMNPNNASVLVTLAKLEAEHTDVSAAMPLIEKAFQLDPLNPDTLGAYADILMAAGDVRRSADVNRMNVTTMTSEQHRRARTPGAMAKFDDLPRNMGFEDGLEPWYTRGICQDRLMFEVDDESTEGQNSLYLTMEIESPAWCYVIQTIRSEKLAGKYIKLVGDVRSRGIERLATLFLRVDTAEMIVSFDNGWPGFVRQDNDWHPFEVLGYVPDDAVAIAFGIVLFGEGDFWVDDLRLLSSDDPNFTQIRNATE